MAAFISVEFKLVTMDKYLTDFQKVVFVYLSICAGRRGECYLKQSTIAADLNGTRQRVNRAIAELERRGYIETLRRGKLRTYKPYSQTCNAGVTDTCNAGVTAEKNKHEKNENKEVQGTSEPDFAVFDDERFSFNPDLNQNKNALDQLYTWIEAYNDRMRYPADERRRLPIQGMADFLEVLKTGRRNGKPVRNPAALMRAWLEGTFNQNGGSLGWSYERVFEEREKLENGQDVTFHFLGKSWSLHTPLRRVE